MYNFISGAIAIGCWIVGLYFLRFWRQTNDRLFQIFAFAFAILGLERLIPVALELEDDGSRTPVYILRLAAFALILFGIINKNRASNKSSKLQDS